MLTICERVLGDLLACAALLLYKTNRVQSVLFGDEIANIEQILTGLWGKKHGCSHQASVSTSSSP
jgi:hypothetical protein